MEKDPNEANNLSNNPAYENILFELRQKLLDWMKETNNPLLKGKIKDKCLKSMKNNRK